MSDTPRTDAVCHEFDHEPIDLDVVSVDFSRDLERELNAANDQIKALQKALEEKQQIINYLGARN